MPPLLAVCCGALSMAPSSQLPTPGGPVPTDPTDLPRSPSRFSQHLCLKNSLIVKSTGFPQQDLVFRNLKVFLNFHGKRVSLLEIPAPAYLHTSL